MERKQRLVVIGNGMAGARFVEELLARGGAEQFEIVMFGDEPYGNYNRILLSGVLSGTHREGDIFLNPLAWYDRNGVTLHAGKQVRSIDRKAKLVRADGLDVPYDLLVLATGSAPFLPPIEGLRDASGALKKGVFVFRTLDDCHGIAKYAREGGTRRAAVLGGGLLGLEAARGLLNFELEVNVVHLMPHLMELQLDVMASLILRQTLERMKVKIQLEKQTREVRGQDRVEGLRFRDGTALDCELLVISAGIRPNAGLAKDCGLEVARGVVVDDRMASSDPDIYAIGECAEHRGALYGLVAPLWDQARVLADHLSKRRIDARYVGSKTSTKLKVMGVELAVMGDRDPVRDDDEVVTYSEPARGIYKKLIVRKSKLIGAILLGDASAAPSLLQAFDRGAELPPARGELLFPSARGEGETGIDVAELADDAQVCNCNGVSKGDLVAAVRKGNRSLKMLCDATRAGTGCGACKGQVAAILEAAADGLVDDDPSQHYYVPGVPLTKPDLVAAVRARDLRSVSAVFQALAGGVEDPSSKPGLASLLKSLWGKDYDDERDARFINDRVHANIQKDGTFSVVPRIFGGVTSAAELRRIADVADKHQVAMVKITGGQRIDLLGIAKDKLPEVWRELGMPSGHAYTKSFRTCKTCVGSEFCRYGVGDSTGLGIAIEKRFQGIETPGKLKLATAGCPRNCSEATTKDVGAVAIEGGHWEILVGGAAGSRVRKGDLLCVVDSHEAALRVIGRFIQHYREEARYLERTYDFVERVGIEKVRAIVVGASDGELGDSAERARLDAEMEKAVAAYVDPWTEADWPVHPTQFARVLEIPELAEASERGGAVAPADAQGHDKDAAE